MIHVGTSGWQHESWEGSFLSPEASEARVASLDVREAFVFFNNDPLAAAPADAATLTDLLAERGCEVAPPLQADSNPT